MPHSKQRVGWSCFKVVFTCGLKEVLKCLNFRLCRKDRKHASCAVSPLAPPTAVMKVKKGILTCHWLGVETPALLLSLQTLSCLKSSLLHAKKTYPKHSNFQNS